MTCTAPPPAAGLEDSSDPVWIDWVVARTSVTARPGVHAKVTYHMHGGAGAGAGGGVGRFF